MLAAHVSSESRVVRALITGSGREHPESCRRDGADWARKLAILDVRSRARRCRGDASPAAVPATFAPPDSLTAVRKPALLERAPRIASKAARSCHHHHITDLSGWWRRQGACVDEKAAAVAAS